MVESNCYQLDETTGAESASTLPASFPLPMRCRLPGWVLLIYLAIDLTNPYVPGAFEFTPDGVRRIAEVAFDVNQRTENIGARRLHTVMERLLEGLSFDASDRSGATVQIHADYVQRNLGELAKDQDLARYVL